MVEIKNKNMVIKNSDYHGISRERILELVSEKGIFTFYLGHDYEENIPFKSPLREKDVNPSFNIYTNDYNILMFTDFGTGISGDVFKFVEILPKHRGQLSGLWQTCCKINYDMRLGIGEASDSYAPIKYNKAPAPVKDRVRLQIRSQDMSDFDLAYWDQYGITKETLLKYAVFSTEKVFRNGVEKWKYSKNNPIYTYYFADTNKIKIYFPLEIKERKWKQSYSTEETIQGLTQLPENGELLIITKSLKDVMSLYELGFSAVAPLSEGQIITEKNIDKLKKRFKTIVVLYDNDDAGKNGSGAMKRLYGFDTIFMKSAKDVSDCIKKIGKNETKVELLKIIEDNVNIQTKREYKSDLPWED